MPQAGFTPIQTYNSPTAGHIPVNTDLYAGELAINTTDEKLYFKNTGGTVKLLASTAVFTTTGSGSYVLATSPTITGHPTIEGVTSTGATGTGKFVFDSAPTITGHPTIEGVTSTGATGTGKFVFDSAPTITGHPTIEGVTSTGATGTGKFVFDSAPTITGHPTIEGVTSTGATGTGKFVFDSSPTLSGVTLSDGTANGVAYLNGSKVLTSGSALTFDGTNLGIGTSSPAEKLDVRGTDPVAQVRATNASGSATLNLYGVGSNGLDLAVTQVKGIAEGAGAAAALTFSTRNSSATTAERMRLDSSGNLGLGVVPSAWYTTTNSVALQIGTASIACKAGTTLVNTNGYTSTSGGGWRYIANGYATIYAQADGAHSWYTAPSGTAGNTISFTQAMTVDASGNLLVGATSGSYKITCNGEPGANGYTAWTNYSDERLKENIVDFVSEPVLNKICELRPVSFNYNDKTGFDEESRKRTVSGFIAQEMQRVFPDMVGKTMIGEEEYLDTNLSNLTLYLVKAIQELTARIEKLENKL